MNRNIHRLYRLTLLLPLGVLAPATAPAGDVPFAFGRAAAEADVEAPGLAKTSTLPWPAIPRNARTALRRLATTQDAAITRCVLIERDDQVTYEIHAARRQGLFRRDSFVLTRFSEPASAAEARREERSLRGRLQRLGESLRLDRP